MNVFASRVASRYSARRVASHFWSLRKARTIPMYTDDALRILGLTPPADMTEIKRGYRTMMLKHHPDRGGDTETAIQINEAYQQLVDGVTISRPSGYGYSRPTPNPYQRPSNPPPRPPPPPPRPTPTPPPASGKVRMTWQQAERITGGSSRPEAKDRMRIDSMIQRAKGSGPKLYALAVQMAKSIDSVDKALRRGRAAEEHPDPFMSDSLASQIFYTRAMNL